MARRCRILLLLMLLCGGASLHAASSAESNAFKAAAKKFRNELWDQAADSFAAFVTNYPASTQLPEAILYQAEAVIKVGQFDAGIQLLSTNQTHAGGFADSYLYWIAQAQLGKKNFPAAAQAFDQLVQNYPGSGYRLEACVSAASAAAQTENWSWIYDKLAKSDGVFQQSARSVTNDLIVRGYLLLGEAELARTNFAEVGATVESLGRLPLKPEFAWRQLYLQCRAQLAEGRGEEAFSNTTNLVAAANATGSNRFQAESSVLRAKALEQLKRFEEAVEIYKSLATDVSIPADQQRIAFLKIAEISRARNKPNDAIQILDKYWNQHPQSEVADLVLLTLGELQLKLAMSTAEASTNLLDQALARYETLLNTFTNSPWLGKALLGKGWVLWSRGDYSQSENAFRAAVNKLPVSEDQAVARFKWADAQLKIGNFEGALTNYRALTTDYDSIPAVKERLLEPALYQTVRAAISASNMLAATEAMQKVLDWYPDGFVGDHCLLLVAEGYTQQNNPAEARKWLDDFEKRFPESRLLPEVRLAKARTYEKENNWPAAITNYEAWTETFTNHADLPRAQYYRGWDLAKAGEETNAMMVFTNFVSRFPTNELTARAKWWIGDFYFRNGDFEKAEENYPFTKNFSGSELYFPAQMMAGRAAMARTDYKGAIGYFSDLFNNPASPADLKVQAAFAAADAYISRTDAGATNRPADLKEAISLLKGIADSGTNSQSIRALGRLGYCYQELGLFDEAAEAYRKVAASGVATIGAQRQAKVGLGIIAEKKAEGKPGPEQQVLLKEALSNYVEAFTFERELRNGEQNDQFWLQKAGLESARMAEALGQWTQAINLYTDLQNTKDLSAAMRSTLDKKIAKAREHMVSVKN